MSALREAQMTMARYLRNPEAAPPPAGIEARRLKVYRELVYNNIEGFISSGFPVLRSLYDDGEWQGLVQSFIDNHRCGTPYFLEISQEFIQYLAERHRPRPCDAPFVAELAHYEWVELALDVAGDEPPAAPAADIDPLERRPRLSPVAWLLSYTFPVHRIGAANRPRESTGPTFLVVYRDRTDAVGFMELNAATARLLELVREDDGRCGADLLAQLADELQAEPAAVRDFGAEQLSQFARRGVIGFY
ncbi:HvfC family RiPP maturation protein [Parahaliea mediterranea]|uniref:DNA-binding domain-containing protein n=1 Tax=Parahaliea mediterranea TaxID=651086 RepID=A0A939IJV5_9GAMM|nr:putative DNA-binding domain-containing protein [Parahaliea mediterranea]MBN7796681.1 putative DNA-binding domain-containing protein [Parahaliea mediterranea]